MAFTMRLTPAQEAEAKAFCEEAGMSMTTLVRLAIVEYVHRRRRQYVRRFVAPALAQTPPSEPISFGEAMSLPPEPVDLMNLPSPTPDAIPRRCRKPPEGRSAPCPLRKADSNGYCLRWKACCGLGA